MKTDERDAYTGHRMTSHEWNGIRELNTRIPKLLLWCLAAVFVYSVISWFLLPSWPSINSFTKGLLQTDQRLELSEQLSVSEQRYTTQRQQILQQSFDEVSANSKLMSDVESAGRALYGDNCMACHGAQGQGAPGYPRLNDDQWLWGGEPGQILKTLEAGINSGSDGSRQALMPAFGKDKLIDAQAVSDVAIFIRSLSNPGLADGTRVTALQAANRGKDVFKNNCAGCHGQQAEGNPLLGAPNLADSYWVYGGTEESVEASIHAGRAGYMPAWKERLSDYELKVLALYVSRLKDKANHHNGGQTNED